MRVRPESASDAENISTRPLSGERELRSSSAIPEPTFIRLRKRCLRDAPRRFTQIGSNGGVDEAGCRDLISDYREFGFALFQVTESPGDPASTLCTLASALGLSAPFVPPLYRSREDLYAGSGINLLTTTLSKEPRGGHPAFQSRGAIELHTDGTLQALGEIPTAVLFCLLPASRGGDTILFDAVGAFADLHSREPNIAVALLDERALSRLATIGGSSEFRSGPVFAIRGEELLARYCVTPRDRWAIYEVNRLAEAKEAMAQMAKPGSPFYLTLRLEAGQGIILANDRISHGRTDFDDGDSGNRRMLRALFTSTPVSCAS